MRIGTYDAHTHTTFSDGRNSVMENARQAEACGLEAVVIADHIHEEPHWLDQMLDEVAAADAACDVKVLAGGEGTILNTRGDVSLSEEVADRLDFVLVDFGWQTRGVASWGWLFFLMPFSCLSCWHFSSISPPSSCVEVCLPIRTYSALWPMPMCRSFSHGFQD